MGNPSTDPCFTRHPASDDDHRDYDRTPPTSTSTDATMTMRGDMSEMPARAVSALFGTAAPTRERQQQPQRKAAKEEEEEEDNRRRHRRRPTIGTEASSVEGGYDDDYDHVVVAILRQSSPTEEDDDDFDYDSGHGVPSSRKASYKVRREGWCASVIVASKVFVGLLLLALVALVATITLLSTGRWNRPSSSSVVLPTPPPSPAERGGALSDRPADPSSTAWMIGTSDPTATTTEEEDEEEGGEEEDHELAPSTHANTAAVPVPAAVDEEDRYSTLSHASSSPTAARAVVEYGGVAEEENDDDDDDEQRRDDDPLEALESRPEFSSLVAAMDLVPGLRDELSGKEKDNGVGPFTVFGE